VINLQEVDFKIAAKSYFYELDQFLNTMKEEGNLQKMNAA
jgi:hypothetical protein